jgi:superfamily I DNA/RNA helicase
MPRTASSQRMGTGFRFAVAPRYGDLAVVHARRADAPWGGRCAGLRGPTATRWYRRSARPRACLTLAPHSDARTPAVHFMQTATQSDEVDLVADRIKELCGTNFERAAILVRYNRDVPWIVNGLQRHGIPCSVSAGEARCRRVGRLLGPDCSYLRVYSGSRLWDRPEVRLMQHILNCVLDPANDTSLYEVARAALTASAIASLHDNAAARRRRHQSSISTPRISARF